VFNWWASLTWSQASALAMALFGIALLFLSAWETRK